MIAMATTTFVRSAPRVIDIKLPTGSDAASVRTRVRAMEQLLERSLVIPGINLPVGLDVLIGLVPVLGEIVTTAMGAYIVWEARNLGLPKWQVARMGLNVLFDTAIGAIPLVGDLADLAFRSNTKNLKILLRHIDKHHPEACVIAG
jgi:hypothetical protein